MVEIWMRSPFADIINRNMLYYKNAILLNLRNKLNKRLK